MTAMLLTSLLLLVVAGVMVGWAVRRVSKTVWAVSTGSYSDYRVLAICDSKKRAEQVSRLRSPDSYRDDVRVESFVYIDHDPENVVTHKIQANLWDDGTETDYRQDSRSEWEHDMLWPEQNRPVGWRWVRAPVHRGKGGRLEVYGTDLGRVRRVWSDKRAEIRASDGLRLRKEAMSR